MSVLVHLQNKEERTKESYHSPRRPSQVHWAFLPFSHQPREPLDYWCLRMLCLEQFQLNLLHTLSWQYLPTGTLVSLLAASTTPCTVTRSRLEVVGTPGFGSTSCTTHPVIFRSSTTTSITITTVPLTVPRRGLEVVSTPGPGCTARTRLPIIFRSSLAKPITSVALPLTVPRWRLEVVGTVKDMMEK